MWDWIKVSLIGLLSMYIAKQKVEFVEYLMKKWPQYVTAEGGLRCAPEEIPQFGIAVLKSLAYTLQHG